MTQQSQPEPLPTHIQQRINELTAKLTYSTAGAKEVIRRTVVNEWRKEQGLAAIDWDPPPHTTSDTR